MSGLAFEDHTLGQSFAFLLRARWLAFSMACIAGIAGWAFAEHRGVVRRARAAVPRRDREHRRRAALLVGVARAKRTV
jgi:hypothetical protein